VPKLPKLKKLPNAKPKKVEKRRMKNIESGSAPSQKNGFLSDSQRGLQSMHLI